MKRILLCASIWFISANAFGAEVMSTPIAAEVLNVVDGDTIKVRAHIWLGMSVDTTVRIYGVDTPELKGKCDYERNLALRAKAFTENALLGSDKQTLLHNVMYDKYGGRVIAAVEGGGYEDIGQALINVGLAYPYFGKKKQSWCEGKMPLNNAQSKQNVTEQTQTTEE